MIAGQLGYFLGAVALSLVCSTLAKWIAGALDAEIEGRYGIALLACFIPGAIPLLAHGAFGSKDALAMLAALVAAGTVCWSFRRSQSLTAETKHPRVN